MKLLKQLNDNAKAHIAEDMGAVGAGAVSAMAMPLFATLVKSNKPSKKVKVVDSPLVALTKKKPTLGIAEAFKSMNEGDDFSAGTPAAGADSGFDNSEVMARLKGLEQKEKVDNRDTVSFGLEDDNGGVVRVVIKNDQAQDFERALQSLMANQEADEEQMEIAEILFKLKDQFDIVDVKWPEVVEDEEEDVALAGGDSGQPGEDGADPTGGEQQGDPSLDDDMGGDMGAPAGNTDQTADLLTQVIDMMKADAEARKAEARAREAEAKGKEADSLVAQTMARVKQEEQYLDMDSYNKAKKEETREAKRLAQLAKWKHDMTRDQQGGGDDDDENFDPASMPLVPNRDAAPEEEERSYVRRPAVTPRVQTPTQPKRVLPAPKKRVHPHDIAEFIIGRVK